MNSEKFLKKTLAALAALVLARSFYEVRHIKVTKYSVSSDKLPEGTKLKIVFLTDLHSRKYGRNNKNMLSLVAGQNPDLILIGGDMVTASDERGETDVYSFLRKLPDIAPTYYAVGNHEEYLKIKPEYYGRFLSLKKVLKKAGIVLLDNKRIDIGDNISLYGLEISRNYYKRLNKKKPKPGYMNFYLGKPDKDRYNILLAHTPEFFDVYKNWKPDLVLSGHYHGGIVRLPRLGGVISPSLRLFPEYSAGKFKKGDTNLIVSAGCGTHGINFRLFNRPEVVAVELSSEA